MAEITLQIDGLEQLQRRLNELAQGLGAEVGNALRAEAEIEVTEMKRRTPVLTGVLRGSLHATGPRYSGRDIEVTIRAGGPAAPYAVAVHENLEAFHRNGEAKFVERPLMESAPHLAARVARRIKLR